MEKNLALYKKLFLSTFYLSAFTFGGGYVIVPLMKKKFVEDLNWIEEKEMLDLVAIGQSAPGIIAVNTSILVGYRMLGVKGAIFSLLGTVTPPLIIISIVSIFYNYFSTNPIIQGMLKGMQTGVAAVIISAVFSMGKEVLKENPLIQLVTMIIAFSLAWFFKINIAIIILLGIIIGVIRKK